MNWRVMAIIAPMRFDTIQPFSRLIVLATVLALSSCGWAEFPASRGGPQSVNAPRGNDVFINATAVTVGKGDTVYSIARRHKLSPRDIIDANNLRPPYELNIGQRLKLPQGRVHVVRRGEYMALIAKRYGVDTFSTARINGIRAPYTIFPGQKLRIPRSGSGAVQVASAPVPQTRPTITAPSRTVTPTRTTIPTQPKPDVAPPPKRAGTFSWPLKGKVISAYGPKAKGLHNDGVNIAAARGAAVKAAENGVVAYAGNEIRGFGNLLLIKHAGGWVTAYAHNDQLLVKRGDSVARGQVISKVGSTGSVTSPQLHFELRKGSNAVDPKKYMM